MYVYTRPRRPIAASYRGPGPCYSLPSLTGSTQPHDLRYHRQPAFSLGLALPTHKPDDYPGPCYMPAPNVYNTGYCKGPQFSLHSRPKDLKPAQVPGPGSYSSPDSGENLRYPRSPNYSFGLPIKIDYSNSNPAANTYTIKGFSSDRCFLSTVTQPPSYTMKSRNNVGDIYTDYAKTPGPGTYNSINFDLYKEKMPNVLITKRHFMPEFRTKTPGPAVYMPNLAGKKTSPSYSMGIKHSEFIREVLDGE